MATIKSYTDIEQSKKLAEILPLESADMVYYKYANKPHKNDLDSPIVFKNKNKWYWIDIYDKTPCEKDDILAWSLAALLGVLPNKIISHETAFDDEDAKDINEIYYKRIESNEEGSYVCCYVGNGYKYRCIADNPIDACVAMIEKLYELKML